MELIACSIKDRSNDTFTAPTFFRAKGQAIRAFMNMINKPQNDALSQMMSDYPNDYDLFYMGTWDDQTGIFKPCTPEVLANGANARAQA